MKKDTRKKIWWFKLTLALIISNVFFFLLFSSPPTKQEAERKEGWVEIQIKGELLTPFQSGKKVVFVQRSRGTIVEGILQGEAVQEGKFVAWVPETRAPELFAYSDWEILPYLKNYQLPRPRIGGMHEIRY